MDAAGSGASGVRFRRSFYLFRSRDRALEQYGPFEPWRGRVPHFREGPPPEGLGREGLFAHCFSYLAPVVNMRRYLHWLTGAVGSLTGVSLRKAELEDVAGVAALAREERAEVVVNCLGLGARAVFGDARLYGVRGDLVYVLAPGAEEAHGFAHASDEDDPGGRLTYAVPQGDGVVALAGTAQRLPPEGLRRGRAPAPGPAAEVDGPIFERNTAALPGAVLPPGAGAAAEPLVVGRWSGARPQREGGVRLELEELQGVPGRGGALRVVHDYGHGGTGVVTSWGCAREVAQLARGACPAPLRPRELPAALAPLALHAVARCGQAVIERALPRPSRL
mmetsp:Transcript_100587/g.313545  ORF Transcript_100587/g.313545 Transcript_100587/m.313545 type:complete len:335 (+) Transcript_100587:102-1106(+)